MSSPSFADLGVSQVVCRALAARDIHTPFAVQSLVVPDILAGRDVLAKSPTGSGKTLAFAVPIVERLQATDRRPSALILAPTRELAVQIVEDTRELAHARALSVTAVYGGAGLEKQARQAPKSHIIVATPGRLEDLIARRAFSLEHIRILVLDEADRMLDMGFRPVVERIVKQVRKDRQTLFFSATLDGEAGILAERFTTNAVRHEHTPLPDKVAQIEHRFVRVAHEDKVGALVGELKDRDRGLALVFVRTKRGADRLVKRLRAHDVEALAMHGDKTQNQRTKALARFEAFQVDTLIATDVAARGLDVSGITHVINYDAPEDREGYVHRTGRTGRAGRTGIAVTFVMGDQARDIGKIGAELDLHRELGEAGLTSVSHGGGAGPRQHTRPSSQRGGGSRSGGGRSNGSAGRSNGSGSRSNGSGSRSNGSGSDAPRQVASARPSGSRRGRSGGR